MTHGTTFSTGEVYSSPALVRNIYHILMPHLVAEPKDHIKFTPFFSFQINRCKGAYSADQIHDYEDIAQLNDFSNQMELEEDSGILEEDSLGSSRAFLGEHDGWSSKMTMSDVYPAWCAFSSPSPVPDDVSEVCKDPKTSLNASSSFLPFSKGCKRIPIPVREPVEVRQCGYRGLTPRT